MAKKKTWELEEEEEALAAEKASRPAYVSAHQGALDSLASQVLNRKEFSYDPKTDPLYKSVVDQYVRQGRMAMEDTYGRAQTMTGGYGNSYAQTASQQTYQNYLQQAADRAPEYYRLARDAYDREGQALLERYDLVRGLEEQDYGRYQDALADYYARLDRAQSAYDQEREFQYRQGRDDVQDQQWLEEYLHKLRQYNARKNVQPVSIHKTRADLEARWRG